MFGVMMRGFVAPLLGGLEKAGLGDRMMRGMIERRRRDIEKKNPFGDYRPTQHDIFVATFAKSGTNWMMQIAHQLAWHGRGEFDHIHQVVAWPDCSLFPPLRKYAIPAEDSSVWMAAPEQKRVIKTHFDWGLFPYNEDARYIMVIRDPKDVFVSSYYFFAKGAFGNAFPVDAWYKLFLSPRFLMGGSWAENTAGYWAQRHRPNVLIVSFKSMKSDLEGAVRRVADFLDIRASEDVIARVCERSSFDYMKRVDDKFRPWKMVPWSDPVPMIRSGKRAGSSELLTPQRQREMDAHFMAELKRLGSDFPYEEFCDIAV
jgi:hypothetical protein